MHEIADSGTSMHLKRQWNDLVSFRLIILTSSVICGFVQGQMQPWLEWKAKHLCNQNTWHPEAFSMPVSANGVKKWRNKKEIDTLADSI